MWIFFFGEEFISYDNNLLINLSCLGSWKWIHSKHIFFLLSAHAPTTTTDWLLSSQYFAVVPKWNKDREQREEKKRKRV